MRALGIPLESTVDSAMALGSFISPASASPIQRRASVKGSLPLKIPVLFSMPDVAFRLMRDRCSLKQNII